MMRAGIIGAGAIAFDAGKLGLPMTHAKSYANLVDDVSLVAFVEPDSHQRDLVLAQFPDLVPYISLDAMLSGERLDVVSICSPDTMHEAALLSLVESSVKGVWCEKPLALTAQGAKAVARKARVRGVSIQVNYWRRFIPEIQSLANAVRKGNFGSFLKGSGIYSETYMHNGCHLFDVIELFLGQFRPKIVKGGEALNAQGDGAVLVVGEAGGADVVCAGIPRKPYNIFELDMFFEEARIRLAENGRRVEISRHDQDAAFSHLRLLAPEPEVTVCDWRHSFDHALADLLECIRSGADTKSGPGPSVVCAGTLDRVAELLVASR